MSGPRVLVAGFFAFPIYEPDLCEGLRRAGAEVRELRVLRKLGPLGRLWRWQGRTLPGPGVLAANAALLAACLRDRPQAVFAWQQIPWLLPSTAARLRRAGVRVGIHANDDPFGPAAWPEEHPHFLRTLREVDVCFAYRRQNLDDYARAGARRVELLRAAFDPRRFRPLEPTAQDRARFGGDAIFVGHCEDDGRLQLVEALFASGLDLRVFGNGWERLARPGVQPVLLEGEAYVRALCAARIGLVFLSRRNRDQYTRRCFEIPAAGTLMLAPRTAELRELFREDEEAAFFDGPAELVAQARRYLGDPALRAKVAAAGRRRVLADGHDVDSNAAFALARLLG